MTLSLPGIFKAAGASALLLAFWMQAAAPVLAQEDARGTDAARLLQQGAEAMHQGKPADAEALFQRAAEADPQSAQAFLGLGMARLRLARPDAAAQALAHAVELNPAAPGAHMFLGIAYYQMNRLEPAVSSLEAEAELQPKNAEALTWLGIVELAAGHPDEATGPLDRAAAISPKDPNILDYRARAHTQVARECFQTLYDLDPGSWHVHRALGEMFAAAKEPEQAITEFTAALAEQPNSTDLLEALGGEYQLAGRNPDAEKAYERELALNPQSPVALFNLGRMEIEDADPAAGIHRLQQAIEAHASPAPAYYYLGSGLAKAEHYGEAAAALEKSLDSQPSPLIRQSAWYALIRVYQKLNRPEDSARALDEFKKLKASGAANAGSAP